MAAIEVLIIDNDTSFDIQKICGAAKITGGGPSCAVTATLNYYEDL